MECTSADVFQSASIFKSNFSCNKECENVQIKISNTITYIDFCNLLQVINKWTVAMIYVFVCVSTATEFQETVCIYNIYYVLTTPACIQDITCFTGYKFTRLKCTNFTTNLEILVVAVAIFVKVINISS